MPFSVTRRVERYLNLCGTQESAAMLESTAGPPRKPVLAATNKRPASSASTTVSATGCDTGPSKPMSLSTAPKATAL
jgi:hypothetical protein